ncbi:MAG: metal ABC transporter permease [candidate division KSB1 bacterium]|nr:metal ABC transporter permease [candidate division KSB1 bacterium]MDZ7273478.1 metal ABC transporter permease [candidate division KSB1 bacterium]MDZ7286930.1 metal ABC transporter permease [candidate division KSB1 bacterium]MDZ7299717.1 metal ABC transporter permease [candidate division KSB1 bacterium]MDZ7305656.1 metal ABC transporter permease [candidate division KSB1 bacterium]
MIEDFLRTMTYPMLACLLLAGIHVYLGIHVLARKVIFVDLALAQIAALGAVYGVLLGYDLDTDHWSIKLFSLLFASVGAVIFSLTRMRHERVPQEAIIGITYAVALATTILITARLAHGAEQVETLLAGSILWVRGPTIVTTAVLYAAIGLFHYRFRRHFLLISHDPLRAEAEGIPVRLWDFLFYFTFGFVVTSSVAIAGVLLVFCFLVIPAVIAVLFADRLSLRLTIGWVIGGLVSLLGVVISYASDLPSGPTIVVCFAVFLVASGILWYVQHAVHKTVAVLRVAAGGVAVAAFFGLTLLFEKTTARHAANLLASPLKNERLLGLHMLSADSSLDHARLEQILPLLSDAEAEVRGRALRLVIEHRMAAALPQVLALLDDPQDLVREDAVRAAKILGHAGITPRLLAAAEKEQDEYIRVELAEAALELGDPRGLPVLLDMMDTGEATDIRKDAHEHLCAHLKVDFPFHAEIPAAANDSEIRPFRQWWAKHRHQLKWDPQKKIFSP